MNSPIWKEFKCRNGSLMSIRLDSIKRFWPWGDDSVAIVTDDSTDVEYGWLCSYDELKRDIQIMGIVHEYKEKS